MRLQLESTNIKDVQFADRTYVSNSTLFINREELKSLLADPHFQDINIEVAKPGESTRIINIADIFEPRCKISGGSNFPGMLEETVLAGTGVTRALKGVAVVICDRHPHWIHSKSIIEMTGPGAEMGRYGKMINIVLDPVPNGDIPDHDYARSLKLAGLKMSVYLAKATEAGETENVEVFDLETFKDVDPGLPRVAYYYQVYSPQHDPRGIPDPIFYGYPISTTLPLVVHPNEIIDGAILSGYTIRMMESYSIQNHPVVTELLKRHGKDLNFAGVVVGVCSMEPIRRRLAAMMVGNLVKNTLGADGVIMTKALGGAPNVDLGAAAVECENLGVKTSMLIQILNTEASLDKEVMFKSPKLNAIVNTGVIFQTTKLPALSRIIGGNEETPVFGNRKQTAGQDIEVEQRFICGCLNQLGASCAAAVEY